MSTLGERIKFAREQKGLLQSELAKLINVKSSGVISNWEKDLNKPDAEKIVRICSVLDVSASYLLDYYGKSDNNFTAHETNHINKYRNLDKYGQELVDLVLDKELDRCQKTIPATIINMKNRSGAAKRLVEYFRSVSAGSGVFILGNEIVDHIEIPATSENRNVDYAIKVSGDSMEPDYHDGDTVLVSQKLEMNYGDVGIFVINGSAYIKEYGKDELISRNPNFDNISVSEYDNIVCMGKVIGKLKD